MKKFSTEFNGVVVNWKADKKVGMAIESVLWNILNLNKIQKSVSGIHGKPKTQRTVECMVMFSTNPVRDEAGYLEKMSQLLEGIATADVRALNASDYSILKMQAYAIKGAHIPIIDERITESIVDDRKAEQLEHEAKQAKEAELFNNIFGSSVVVERPEGQMAITLQVTFDDGDIQSDYYRAHAPLGKALLLDLTTQTRQTERLARSVLAKYPELAKLDWKWKTENYSMGHGNYLISDWIGEWERKAYDGREVVSYRYEIQITKYVKDITAYKNYGQEVEKEVEEVTEVKSNNSEDVTVELNDKFKGIEITFNGKPSEAIRNQLKELRFRWHRIKKLWFAKQNEKTLAYAEALTA